MLVKINDLANIRAENQDKKIILTSGTYDLFHVGHLSYLEQVKEYGDIVVVLLSGDHRVKHRKGSNRPIITESDRARILDSLKIVDHVIIDVSVQNPDKDANETYYANLLEKLQPNYYVTDGPDPRFINLLDKSKFIIVERMQPEPSTTAIIKRVKDL